MVAHYFRSETDAHSLQSVSGCALFQADFASIPVADLRARLDSEVGQIDILINNASCFTRSDWKDIDESLWENEMSVNLKVPFFLMQHFGQRMKSAGKGKIISLLDIAIERPYLSYLPYSIAKAGLASATRAMARALAPDVQVNGIAPGTILFAENMPDEQKQKSLAKIPARRPATIDEYLRTVDFLLSDVDYITGQIVTLDGGRSLTW